LKISQGVKATLFLEDYFQGPAVVFSSNWLNFSSINLHKLTTLNVERTFSFFFQKKMITIKI